jgi:hypothetical protein
VKLVRWLDDGGGASPHQLEPRLDQPPLNLRAIFANVTGEPPDPART